MDSLTQLVLGASVAEAVIGKKVGNKAIFWGAIAGTIPDLDVFFPTGNAVEAFTYHRSASHSFFVLALITPLVVWIITAIHKETYALKKRWMLAIYLVFATHILLDSFTAYGTQIFWPIVNTPVSWSTLFIIDPLYTIPLVIGVLLALRKSRSHLNGHLINTACLALSTFYLLWSVAAKTIVHQKIVENLDLQAITYHNIFITPAPFNTLLWRAVIKNDTGYYEVYYSLLDRKPIMAMHFYKSDEYLLERIASSWAVQRLQWFTHGFYGVELIDNNIVMKDLRMGLEPHYVFQFVVGNMTSDGAVTAVPIKMDNEYDVKQLKKIWHRIWDESIAISP